MTIFDADLFGQPTTPADQPAKWSERDMLDLLHQRYSQTSHGSIRRYVVAEHVRSACGFAGASWDGGYHPRTMRTADFVAQDTWEAQGLHLHGHEVKVTRADWLTELADPTKADAIRRYCDRWWLVVPDRAIVRDDLPDGWGLLAIGRDQRLRVVRTAPTLTPEPMPATFRASLLRATAKTARRAAA